MFCPVCGKKIKETASFCAYCGTNIAELKKDAVQNIQQNNNAVRINFDDNYPKAYPDIRTEPQAVPYNPTDITAPEELYPDYDDYDEYYDEPPKSRRGLVIGLIIAGVVLAAGIAVGAILFMNSNSVESKTDRVVSSILDGHLTEARQELDSFDAENEEAIREYISVLDKRDVFLRRYDNNTCVQINKSSVIDARDDFCSALRSFRKNYDTSLLPEKLKEQCEGYAEKLAEIDKLAKGIEKDFENAQAVFMNEVYCNRSDNFTLRYIQTNIDISNEGLAALKEKLEGDDVPVNWSDESNEQTANFRRLMTSFKKAADEEIRYSESDIKKNLNKGFKMGDTLYRVKADPDYVSYICGDLGKVENEDDIADNALIFRNTLVCSFSASIIENN